jgi:DNA-binding transcriptional MerR regulator
MSSRDQDMPKNQKNQNNNRKYSPADICLWFGIPRTTLFRWEELGEIPIATRGPKGERIYEQKHIMKIANMVRARLGEEIDLAAKYHPASPAITLELLERLDLVKFFSSNEDDKERGLEALMGLARQKRFNPETEGALFDEARRRPSEDKVRQKILEVILFHDQQRSEI